MSVADWYLKNHCKVVYNTDPKADRDFAERQSMYKAFMSGMSLPEMLDRHYLEPEFKLKVRDGKRNPHMVFDNPITEGVAERPCTDSSIMYYEKGCKSLSSIEYDKNEFQQQMSDYWGV